MSRPTMNEQAALGLIGQGGVWRPADTSGSEYVTHPENKNLITREEIRVFLDRGWAYWSEPDDDGRCKLRWTTAGQKAYDGPTR